MSPISRREFLKITGTAAAAIGLTPGPVKAGTSAPAAVKPATEFVTGFHWCIPSKPWTSTQAKRLLQQANVEGTVVMLTPSSRGKAQINFVDACDKIQEVNRAGASGDLSHVIARIWSPFRVNLQNVDEADQWLTANGFYDSLDYFVAHGGRMVVIFNELNVSTEQQYAAAPHTLAYIAYALRSAYRRGNERLLYTLFPGPSAKLAYQTGKWTTGFYDYFAHYDLLAGSRQARTFGEVYGTAVDSRIAEATMLSHGGRGVFDGLALHCYTDNPNELFSHNTETNRALQYLAWTRDHIDDTSWVYVTECGGTTGRNRQAQYNGGAALADFTYNAYAQFALEAPHMLRGVYGSMLHYTDMAPGGNAGNVVTEAFLEGYNRRRERLGF